MEELPFDAKLDRARELLEHNPNYRLVFYRILRHCQDGARPLDELEEFVDGQPGYAQLKQPPYFPIHWLEQAFALEEMYLDAEGGLHAAGELAELGEDEFDDLVAQFAFRTTDVGRVLADQADPESRLRQILGESGEKIVPGVLFEFRQKLQSDTDHPGATTYPGVYVDKLAEAGAIAFDDGWVVTDEGRGLLQVSSAEEQ